MMKHMFTWMFFSLFAVCAFGQKAEEKLVRKTFEDYKSAILDDRGAEAVTYVDNKTVAYYSRMLELALHADSLAVDTLMVVDKLMVLAIRHRTSREQLLSFDGPKLIQYAIESGMVGKNSVANNSIGDVIIDNFTARGQLIVKGEKTDFYFLFNKEQHVWKIDLTSAVAISSKAVESMITESGQSENDYILSILQMISGTKPGPEIWLPVE